MRDIALYLLRLRRYGPSVLLALAMNAMAIAAKPVLAPISFLIPTEVSSSHFVVSIDGQRTPVMHAAAGYYLLNFDVAGDIRITITASDPHYWDAGVEVQPMRYGIRPERNGASISFPLSGPAKLSITRPGDHFGDSEMLFLFANAPDDSGITATTPGVRYFGPGVHRENIDARNGDRIYLAAGAVVFGSLNLWQVHDVHISGRGTIIYNGPQNPNNDEGWMHKPNWHVIVMDNANGIEIDGITCIVRSRTWMVQMRDSRGIVFRNVKVIGASAGDANQDGMDWLGGGDTLVEDCFFRAADDIFAAYGNWDGYSEAALATPGHEVSHITIEKSVLSTSISNVVRVGWPRKIFDSHDFTLRDSDVIHMGEGSCGVPFALFEIWADPAGKGSHTGYRFENIRLEDWYSLVQLRQPNPQIQNVAFTDIWAMDGPGMVPSALKSKVGGVSFQGVNLGSGDALANGEVPLDVLDGAQPPVYEHGVIDANFTYTPGLLQPHSEVAFTATGDPKLHYEWFFGDGATAEGAQVHHVFPDAQGTLLDGSGRFRVLLSAADGAGHRAWASQSVVVAASLSQDQIPAGANLPPGLDQQGARTGAGAGFLRVPADGGYTFTLLTSTTASLLVDGVRAESTKLRPQVCGSPGSAVQAVRLSAPLARGMHRIVIVSGPEVENARPSESMAPQPVLLWEGPGIPRQAVPKAFLFHADRQHEKE